MSLWGPQPFDNDDAADLSNEISASPSLTSVENALIEVSHPSHVGYVDITDCCNAIAAAEVLARLVEKNDDADMLDPAVWSCLRADLERLEPGGIRLLLTHAMAAVNRVLHDAEDSELAQVIREDALLSSEWNRQTTELLSRLRAAASNYS